jgi:archaeal type IV pilus assembly protein PilA
MNFRKIKKNFRRNTKAISPVIATLLMIAIAVVASLVTYAWVMGYMSFTTNKTGLSIQIQSVSNSTTGAVVYVENIGSGQVTFKDPCVYVNGQAFSTNATLAPNLAVGSTVGLQLSGTPFLNYGQTYTIKVTSTDGTFSQIDKIFQQP